MQNHLLRALPSIDRMLLTPLALELAGEFGRERVRDLLRNVIDELRAEISGDAHNTEAQFPDRGGLSPESLENEIGRRLAIQASRASTPSLRRVINATGVIVHTNLGRAPLANKAIEAIAAIGASYSNLEYDLETGERGRREAHCRLLVARLAGSEDAIVANNNAAAVMLVLNSLAEGGEVIVSRGELIEIGGSFRIPEVMEKSGARLREVGTTNRTKITDYQKAITDKTKLILRVHPSNYRIIGFTERPAAAEIAELALRAGIPAYEDLGSGCLIDLAPYGVTGEPVVADSLRAGMSIVSFSGDKMLGGPQAGIIAGSRALIGAVRKNPLMRALRVDKITYAALEATLRLYERGAATTDVPVIRAIAMTYDQLRQRASRMADEIGALGKFSVNLRPGSSVVGGGSAPGIELPTVLIELENSALSDSSVETMLRESPTPIITRVESGRVVIDLRTVSAEEEPLILDALKAMCGAPAASAAT